MKHRILNVVEKRRLIYMKPRVSCSKHMYSPVGQMQTHSTHNIPPVSLSGSLVDCCPPLAMHWPNILGVESCCGGTDVDKWESGVSNDPTGLGGGRAESDSVLFEGFILAVLSLTLSLYLCERVILGVKWRHPPHPHLSTRICTWAPCTYSVTHEKRQRH